MPFATSTSGVCKTGCSSGHKTKSICYWHQCRLHFQYQCDACCFQRKWHLQTWLQFWPERKASACARARGIARGKAWLTFRAQRHEVNSRDAVWMLNDMSTLAVNHVGAFGRYIRTFFATACVLTGRQRDIYPMRPIQADEYRPASAAKHKWCIIRLFANVCFGGLHFLYNACLSHGYAKQHTIAQQSVCTRLTTRTMDFLTRLESVSPQSVQHLPPPWYKHVYARTATTS